MLRHIVRPIIATFVSLALAGAVLAAWEAVPVAPQRLTYTVTQDGPTLRWWQASNADSVVLLNECAAGGARHDLLGYEAGQPGWHVRPIVIEAGQLHSCIRLNEFYEGDWLGSYGPFPLAPWHEILPVVAR
ncbi:MAG: hypothetical protein HGA45_27370 [Chloroflexales bacterium]|nr:hypothetical protein [Chloroflexales bacterium]